MDIRPILSTLRRHKMASALIVLEIALSCAIICNAVFLINERLDRVAIPSGLTEDEIVVITLAGIGKEDNGRALTRQDLAALRNIPGVKAAAITNQVPFGSGSWNGDITLQPEQVQATINTSTYMDSDTLRETFGLQLVAGRDFNPDEFMDYSPSVESGAVHPTSAIITRTMAERLYPGRSGVGEVFYVGDVQPVTVVGVVESLLRPYFNQDSARPQYAMLMPVRMSYGYRNEYVLRTSPEMRARVMADAVTALMRNGSDRLVIKQQTLSEMREAFFRQDVSMVWLLIAVCVALLVVTALGIVGLASFWVQQRTKQIGIRRALGATRGQVLRYFQTENFLLATLGIVIGMIGAYGINQLLMSTYELPRLPALYLPVGAAVLWALGQIAVWGPARRAASVPPAVATRTV